MTTLHIVRTSRFADNNFNHALTAANNNDAVVLIDDGCYCLNALDKLDTIERNPLDFFVIDTHAAARAMQLTSSVNAITMEQLVELTFSYQRVITWQ
ncbi:MAG: sulfurtransferase complex subunit TusB [Thalassotalea sp.]